MIPNKQFLTYEEFINEQNLIEGLWNKYSLDGDFEVRKAKSKFDLNNPKAIKEDPKIASELKNLGTPRTYFLVKNLDSGKHSIVGTKAKPDHDLSKSFTDSFKEFNALQFADKRPIKGHFELVDTIAVSRAPGKPDDFEKWTSYGKKFPFYILIKPGVRR